MKKLSILVSLVLMALALALSFAVVVAQEDEVDRTGWPETFIIGVYPGDNIEGALASVEPLRAYLEERLGVRTVIITGTSYTAVIEAMRAGRADAIEVGPFTYVLANREANAEAIAVANYVNEVTLENFDEVVNPEDLPGYYSLFFTRKGSGVRTIEDIAGRSLAFTDPASASGYLIPATRLLVELGFSGPAELEEFAQVIFAGNHPAAVLSVSNGTTDVGATFDANLPLVADRGDIELCGYDAMTGEFPYYFPMTQEEIEAIYDECPDGNIVVIAQSAVIPETPFAVRADLPESFKDAVRDVLLDLINDRETVVEFQRFYVDPREALGIEEIDEMYNGLRDAAELLGLDLNR
jgi:phosphonate transport system substrate-binding protein